MKRVHVLGEQMAKATQAEERRKAEGNAGQSPMPKETYDFWRGELSLIDPVPNPLDVVLGELCQRFARSDAPNRAGMRAAISMDEFYTLLTFSRRTAVLGLREWNVDGVVAGLTAIAMIEAERTDFRDILIAVSLLYHSATRLGANADQLLRDTAALAEDETAKLIIGFVNRPRQGKDLRSSWGYDEVETTAGIGFIGWRFKNYNPTYDMKKIAIDIADFIETDKYQLSSIHVATDLPRCWLEAQDDVALDQALQAVRAAASIDARLRPYEHPQHAQQLFLVFVVELADHSAARKLLDISRKKRPSTYNMLGLAEGRLFCLAVARSWEVGIEAFETAASLSRFSVGIAGILNHYVRQQ